MQRQTISLTTDASGDLTVYSGPVSGRILVLDYTKGTLDAGLDFTITTETTLQTVWTESNITASKVCCPRLPIHSPLGVAALYAAGGQAVLGEYVWAMYERIKIVIAQGGNVGVGSILIITDD